MTEDFLVIFAQSIVNLGKCNSVDAVLDDYDAERDRFYVYKSEYELFKETIKLLGKAK